MSTSKKGTRGRNMMVPDMYTREKLALAHRQQFQSEAEYEQMLGESPEHSSQAMRHLVGKLGTSLILLGSWLRQHRVGLHPETT
jgi:hypothetical protein